MAGSRGMTIDLTRAACIATKWFIVVRTIENVHFEHSVELREISRSYNHTKKTDGIMFNQFLYLNNHNSVNILRQESMKK